MRRKSISINEYYHIFNRGVGKKVIFHDQYDLHRFLFLILYFQSSETFQHIGRMAEDFRNGQHRVLTNIEKDILKNRSVELVSFCLMHNHFHLIVKEVTENGIANYMQRVLNSYSKYYNTKYEKSGHVFQGPYKAVHIADDKQLLYLSAYIHRNSRELKEWKRKEEKYQWSSYQDFINENRFNLLLVSNIIIEQFKSKIEYKKFVDSSTSKLSDEELISINLG